MTIGSHGMLVMLSKLRGLAVTASCVNARAYNQRATCDKQTYAHATSRRQEVIIIHVHYIGCVLDVYGIRIVRLHLERNRVYQLGVTFRRLSLYQTVVLIDLLVVILQIGDVQAINGDLAIAIGLPLARSIVAVADGKLFTFKHTRCTATIKLELGARQRCTSFVLLVDIQLAPLSGDFVGRSRCISTATTIV